MERGSITVHIHHQAGMTAANTVNVKHRGLVDFNAFQGSTFKHRNIPKNSQNYQKAAPVRGAEAKRLGMYRSESLPSYLNSTTKPGTIVP